MSRPEDSMSAVDRNGRLKGIEGLRVADASIFPVAPCSNTNFPTLMVAEKIADGIIAGK
ncbi:MAG: GMC oxidoreductase [Roseomonas sp.]